MRKILRPRVLVGTLAGLITLYSLVGFFLLPYLIQSYVIPEVSEQIKHPDRSSRGGFQSFRALTSSHRSGSAGAEPNGDAGF